MVKMAYKPETALPTFLAALRNPDLDENKKRKKF
jgi:hypothetical protein